jgi:hypothetical protein
MIFPPFSELWVADLLPVVLAHSALPAFFGAVPTILTVLAGVTRIGTCARGGKHIERDLIDENKRQHDLSEGREHLLSQHDESSRGV